MLVDVYWDYAEKLEDRSFDRLHRYYYTTQTEHFRLRKRAAIYTLGVPFRIVAAPLYFLCFVLKNVYRGIRFLIKASLWKEPVEQPIPPVEKGPYR